MDNFRFYDLQPKISNFPDEVLAGLSKQQKQIPPKFFYDEYGSKIFDQICELEEYYPTRTEFGILQQHSSDIADEIGENSLIIEYGSGSSKKIGFLLDSLIKPLIYMPIDISRQHMLSASKTIADKYPNLKVLAVYADYTTEMLLPEYAISSVQKKVIFFPGTTIGNLEPEEAIQLLKRSATIVGSGGGMLIGFDMKKDPQILHAAYNDSKGVTAAFNMNLLTRINRELDADFNLNSFNHYALFNVKKGRIEMHLVSLEDQIISVADRKFKFIEGESIHTENSYKFSMEEIKKMSEECGFKLVKVWSDNNNYFSICYLSVV
ncbi:L-histidine N(alpha)-methyltransferase [Oscillatoria sp. HE19RPO]|uniref:L-histidine N(alpha)-methyltransferase n=1 Tax=Oscillatoria sp. HE19RPO TaxID=2954806 RepID=UPI0020C3DD99|nr:L-histidine N(alpha)-methyltransferase [Oscillatoria sp. HE19RPO]